MSYEPLIRAPDHWLLLDGSTIADPRLETTPARRRVRIAGSEDSVSRNDMDRIIVKDVLRRARSKGTSLLLKLGRDPNDPGNRDSLIGRQVGNLTGREKFAPYSDNRASCEASWVFAHPRLPVFARVKLEVVVRSNHGGSPSARVSLIFPNLSQLAPDARWYNKSLFTYNGQHNLGGVHERFWAPWREAVGHNPITFETKTFSNSEAAMEYAIGAYRVIDGLGQLVIPDLRGTVQGDSDGAGQVGTMTLNFDQALQPDSYLGGMVEFADTIKPANEILEHWNEITKLLRQRGVSVSKSSLEQTLAVLLGTKSEPIVLTPYRATRFDGIEYDRDHRVHLDVYNGTVHVSCSKVTSQPTKEDLLAYEIAKERAAITGETDLLAAFMASIEGARQEQEAQQVTRAARHT